MAAAPEAASCPEGGPFVVAFTPSNAAVERHEAVTGEVDASEVPDAFWGECPACGRG